MNNHRYQLDQSSKKFLCPDCGKKRFVRYIDTQQNDKYLPEIVGRCDRESKCQYHHSPKHFFSENPDYLKNEKWTDSQAWKTKHKPKRKAHTPQIEFFDKDVFKLTLRGYAQNVFTQNLLERVPFPFTSDDITRMIELYALGTITGDYLTGALTFPFIDINKRVRTIQVKQFDQTNHTTKTSFLHAMIKRRLERKGEPLPDWLNAYLKNDKYVSCLFGEHLLNDYPLHTVCICEAPKTAIYGVLYFGLPDQSKLIWLATYNLSSLTFEKCKVLQGRNVVLFPDLSKDGATFEKWSKRANEFNKTIPDARFRVSDYLERLAPEQMRKQGADIADVLIQMDWKAFRAQNEPPQDETPPPQHNTRKAQPEAVTLNIQSNAPDNRTNAKSDKSDESDSLKKDIFFVQKSDWSKDITALEKFFSEHTTTNTIDLYPNREFSNIENVPLFVKTYLGILREHNGNDDFLVYLNRLQTLQMRLSENSI